MGLILKPGNYKLKADASCAQFILLFKMDAPENEFRPHAILWIGILGIGGLKDE